MCVCMNWENSPWSWGCTTTEQPPTLDTLDRLIYRSVLEMNNVIQALG